MQPAKLVYHTQHGGKVNFSLHREETGIGRKEDNHIVLTCAKMSKYHAYVKRKDNKYYVFDRKSSNGVKVNDVQIEPSQLHELQDGDVIKIGTISLTFCDEAAAQGNGDASEPNGIGSSTSAGIDSSSAIRAELEAAEDVDLRKVGDVRDISTLREDYEKLCLAYELSKTSLTDDTNQLLAKFLDLMFEILPVDRGVILLVDQNTGILGTRRVKLRDGEANEGREILLSSTILRKVYFSRMCLITSDACEDPNLGDAASVKYGKIRGVICVPLIANKKVHGILYLDSLDRIDSFSFEDLTLVQAVSNQTAMAIENRLK